MLETSDKKLLCICPYTVFYISIQFLEISFYKAIIFVVEIQVLNHYVLVVQYFCQLLHYDNLCKIRT